MENDIPLQTKLGLKPNQKSFILNAPADYKNLLPQPKLLSNAAKLSEEFDWLQAFYTAKLQLENEIILIQKHLTKNGQLWLCWPKKSSNIKTDLDDKTIRQIGLSAGLVDIKVAAINETWSGLKFVYRLKDR